MCTSRSTPAAAAARATTAVPSTPTRCWVSRSLPIGWTVVTTASAPATTSAANDSSEKSPTRSSTPACTGAVRGRRTTARTAAPRSARAAHVRAPTRPLAPMTTTTGWREVGDWLIRTRWHAGPTAPGSADQLLDPGRHQPRGGPVPGLVEEGGALAGDEGELEGPGTVAGGVPREAGGRVDRAGRPDGDEEVGGVERVEDPVQLVGHLAEPDDVGPELARPALRARRQVREVLGPPQPGVAGAAQGRVQLAVHVDDPGGAG